MRKTGTIYCLRCPISNEIRYVGQTMITLERKLYIFQHRVSSQNLLLTEWFEELRAAEKFSELKIEALESHVPESNLNKRETFWINKFYPSGILCNKQTDGHVNRSSFFPRTVGLTYRRYITIDRMIREHKPTLENLIDAINNSGTDIKASKRTVQMDIEAMRYSADLGFYAPIEFSKKGMCYKYTDPDYTLMGAIAKLFEGELIVEQPQRYAA